MKRILVAVIIMLSLIVIIGCNKRAIEDAISKFEDAVNANNVTEIEDVLSPDSDFYITGQFQAFLDEFSGFTPLDYSGLDIDVDGDDADVDADASFIGLPEENALFVMKKDDGESNFFDPVWKVKEYWDTRTGTLEFVWKKLMQTRH
jgi:hypothetical protein